jgi:hypothetical protein
MKKNATIEFIVYMATNIVNGERYIGATKLGINARRDRHFKDCNRKGRDCPRFYNAIRKYGRDAFEWTVLTTLPTVEKMYKEEERLIALLKPEYNIAAGALIFTSKEKQTEFQAASAQRRSKPVICLNDGIVYPSAAAAAKAYGVERHNLAQLCNRGGVMRNGLSFIFFTEPMSDEERLSLLSSVQERKVSSEDSRVKKLAKTNGRSVTCLNDGIIYQSALAAERDKGLVRGIVQYLCKTGKTHKSGLCFAYGAITGEERLRFFEKAKAKKAKTLAGWKEKLSKLRSFPVICINTGEIYPNTAAAGRACGLSGGRISELCRDGRKSKTGLSFRYLELQTRMVA